LTPYRDTVGLARTYPTPTIGRDAKTTWTTASITDPTVSQTCLHTPTNCPTLGSHKTRTRQDVPQAVGHSDMTFIHRAPAADAEAKVWCPVTLSDPRSERDGEHEKQTFHSTPPSEAHGNDGVYTLAGGGSFGDRVARVHHQPSTSTRHYVQK
jgi:hypothetical protein